MAKTVKTDKKAAAKKTAAKTGAKTKPAATKKAAAAKSGAAKTAKSKKSSTSKTKTSAKKTVATKPKTTAAVKKAPAVKKTSAAKVKKPAVTAKKSVPAKKPVAAKKAVAAEKSAAKSPAKKIGSKKIDWANLPFGYISADKRFVANYKNGEWIKGKLISENTVTISECAGVLQYAQTVFEGLKAYMTEDGRIVTFRPDLNAERMMVSCERLEMPIFPKKDFVAAVLETVKANKKWVPPYGSGATLYIRPYMFGSNAVIGVKPADEYQFRIFVTPVGPYFKGGAKSITIRLSDRDRAAPHGTGDIKAGLNYAMSLHNIVDAHKNGFAENLYLDPATHTYVEETGGANILFVAKDGKIVTPKSNTILPSITRRSIIQVAKDYLHIPIEERQINKNEISSFVECGLCGTAAVISPVGTIIDHGKKITFANSENEMGPVLRKVYDTLTGIQLGRIAAPAGWIHEIK